MGKVIAVLSGKGGVGKTTIAANLAVVLAKMGKKVLAVDANLTSSGLTTHFGLSPSYGLTNLLDGNKKEEDVVMMSDIDNLYVIGTTFRIESFSADLRRMKAVMDKLRKDYDFIIVDAAPTLGAEAKAVIDACDEVILVTEPAKPSVLELMRISFYVREKGKSILGLVVNKAFESRKKVKKIIEFNTGMEVIACIPFINKMEELVNRGEIYVLKYPNSMFSKEVENIARVVLGKERRKEGKLDGLRWFLESRF